MTSHTFRIALLICDSPLPTVRAEFGDYEHIFGRWLRDSLSTYTGADAAPTLHIDNYNVFDGTDFPPLDKFDSRMQDSYDAVVITGSRHTAHEMNPPFIPKLIDLIRVLGTNPKYLHVKLVGICFGHQIIAWAMGGCTERGTRGWEVGVYGCEITDEGREWFIPSDDTDGTNPVDKIYLQQMHRDHVPHPPTGFLRCLRTAKYPVQAMVKPHSTSTSARPVLQILGIQGHPEFIPEIVERMVAYRTQTGVFDAETSNEAKRRVWGEEERGGEGWGRLGWSVWKMLLTN